MRTLAIFVLLASLVAPATDAEVGVTDKEIVLASCVDLKGSAKVQSHDLVTGADAYFNSVNEHGGVHGRKIVHDVYDDGYDPDKAILCFKALENTSAFALFLSYGSPTGLKYSQMALANKVPYFPAGAGADFFYKPVNRYLFITRASYDDEGRAAVEHLWNDLKMRRFGAIYQDDPGAVLSARRVRERLESLKAPALAMGSYQRNTLDVDDAIAKVRAADPEVVLLFGPYAPNVEVLKHAKATGWRPLFVAIGPRDPLTKAGEAAEGVVITQVVPAPDRTGLPGIRRMRALLKKDVPDEKPSYYSVEGFLSAMIFVEGLKRAGRELTRESFVDAVESIRDFDTGMGRDFRATFDKERHGAFKDVYFTVVKDGKPVAFTDWTALKPAARR